MKKKKQKYILFRQACQWHEGYCGEDAITFVGHKWLCLKHVKELYKRLKEIIKKAWTP